LPYTVYYCCIVQLENDTTIERFERDQPMCVDILDPDPDPETDNSTRRRRSFEPDEICWNIDRCDEGGLPPLDGVYCPPVDGMFIPYKRIYHILQRSCIMLFIA